MPNVFRLAQALRGDAVDEPEPGISRLAANQLDERVHQLLDEITAAVMPGKAQPAFEKLGLSNGYVRRFFDPRPRPLCHHRGHLFQQLDSERLADSRCQGQ